MKILGHTLTWIGFLAGAFLAVEQAEGVDLPRFFLALGVGVAGVALVRFALYREASHEDKLVTDIATLRSSLEKVVADVAALDRAKETVDVYDLRYKIDDFRVDLNDFVEARESIAHRFGLAAYGEVMSHFAAAERYLNRVWSASTDGYVDEAREYIGRAGAQLAEAKEALLRIVGAAAEPERYQKA
jgi:hypothetical protein